MDKFEVGDLVTAKVGGPTMMVSIIAPGQGAMVGTDFITCNWWDQNVQAFKQWNFYATALNPVVTD